LRPGRDVGPAGRLATPPPINTPRPGAHEFAFGKTHLAMTQSPTDQTMIPTPFTTRAPQSSAPSSWASPSTGLTSPRRRLAACSEVPSSPINAALVTPSSEATRSVLPVMDVKPSAPARTMDTKAAACPALRPGQSHEHSHPFYFALVSRENILPSLARGSTGKDRAAEAVSPKPGQPGQCTNDSGRKGQRSIPDARCAPDASRLLRICHATKLSHGCRVMGATPTCKGGDGLIGGALRHYALAGEWTGCVG